MDSREFRETQVPPKSSEHVTSRSLSTAPGTRHDPSFWSFQGSSSTLVAVLRVPPSLVHSRDPHIIVGSAGVSRSPLRHRHVMVARVLLIVVLFVCGAEAVPFANGFYLKDAVNNCLAYDNTGVVCCGSAHDSGCGDPSTARCGVAGCDEMPSWDVSSVTNMGSMFNDVSASVSYTHLTLPTTPYV